MDRSFSPVDFVLCTLVLAALYAIDFTAGGQLSLSLAPAARQTPLLLLLMAAIDTAVLTLARRRAAGPRWPLVAALFALFFGVKTGLVAMETVYLPEALPFAVARSLAVNGFITALVMTPLLTWGVEGAAETAVLPPVSRRRWRWPHWAGRLLAAGLVWVILFVAAGLLVFRPVAMALDPATADAYLAAFTPEQPLLILGLQWGRGVIWALLVLPILRHWRGSRRERGFWLGLCCAGLMGSSLLLAGEALPAAIWPAHLAEVVVENFLFGLWLGPWLTPPATAGDAEKEVKGETAVCPHPAR